MKKVKEIQRQRPFENQLMEDKLKCQTECRDASASPLQ